MLQRIFLATTLYLFTSISYALCTKPLSVGFAEWPPYQLAINGQYTGFDTEFIEAVTKPGCALSFMSMPWNSQLLNVHSGKLDLAMGVTSTPDREKYAYFTNPYRKEVIKLFVLAKDAKKYNMSTVAELKDISFLLGAELGFYYGKEFSTLMRNAEFAQQVRMVIYTEINVKKLIDQRIDAFIADQEVGEYYISKLGYSKQIVSLPVVINETDVRIMVSKATGSMEFVTQLNKQIDLLLKSEKYKLLESKYLKK